MKKTLGQVVWKYRDSQQLTIRELAKLAGTSHGTVYRIENDLLPDPKIDVWLGLCVALGEDFRRDSMRALMGRYAEVKSDF